jgi:ribosome recycling factor
MIIGLYILEDEGGVSTIEVPTNVGPNIKASALSQMESAIAALSVELSKLRTGRASPGY